MSYDIPDKVRYREKIVFGLDGRQLIYALLFGIAAVLLYSLPLRGDIRLVAPGMIGLTGIGFIFLGFEEKARARWSYVRAVLLRGNKERFARKVIQVDDIGEDAFVLSNGEMRAVLEVRPLNFALFDEDRKKSLISNYRDFLNHLTYHVQILVRTTSLSLEEYYAAYESRAKGIENEALKELYLDFRGYETEFLKLNDVKERSYFLIICLRPDSKDKEEALRKLSERVVIILEKLTDCGIESRRLGKGELLPFIASYFAAGEQGGAGNG
jgi:hypothetical protein